MRALDLMPPLARLADILRWLYRYRTIRLTSDGTRFLLLTFGIGLAAINTGNNLLYLLLAMMLSLIVISGVLSEQTLKHLTVARRLPSELYANRPATGAFVITNRNPRVPAFSLHVHDMVADLVVDRGVRLLHLGPGATSRHPYPLLLTRRGRHRFEGVKVITRFPFGLISKAAALPLTSDVLVYPEIRPLPGEIARELTAIGREQPMPRRGHGSALYNLRDYHSGDDSRAIHWKTSARQSRLIVREAEAEDQRSVTIALATAAPRVGAGGLSPSQLQAFEEAVIMAASLIDALYRRNYRLRLIVGAREVPAGAGREHYGRLLRALALCGPETDDAPTAPATLRAMSADTQAGIFTILIAPWPDRRLGAIAAKLKPFAAAPPAVL